MSETIISNQINHQYIYLLHPREHIRLSEPVYKIGRTTREFSKRMKEYPKDSKIILFIDVIDWRAQGKINEEEFSALYSEWISKPTQDKYSKRIIIGIFPIRQILLQKKCLILNLLLKLLRWPPIIIMKAINLQ